MNWISDHLLNDGTLVRFRHVSPDDAELIAESIRTASPETLLHRFFSPVTTVPIPALRHLLEIDGQSDVCFLGQIDQQQDTAIISRAICGARFVKVDGTSSAEIAITVHDDFQRRGLGKYLLSKLAELAAPTGIEQFIGFVLPSNIAMLQLIEKVAPIHERYYLGDVVKVVFRVADLNRVDVG